MTLPGDTGYPAKKIIKKKHFYFLKKNHLFFQKENIVFKKSITNIIIEFATGYPAKKTGSSVILKRPDIRPYRYPVMTY